MKKILTSAGLVLLAMICVPSRMIEMDKDTLLDKIKGGWADNYLFLLQKTLPLSR